MITLGTWGARPVTISLKPACLTISIDNPAEATVLSYDKAGRLWTAFVDKHSYRRGLDGKILAKRRLEGRARERWYLSGDGCVELETQIHTLVTALYGGIRGGQVRLNTPLPPEALAILERAAAFDTARSRADAVRCREVYQPVGILPPDQYMAVVLQLTEGCSFNTCTFCNFYKDRPFRIKTPEELRAHAEAVRDFLGAGLSLRRTIFLGDANALVVPMPRLVPLIETVHGVYDVEALGGMYAFLDGFSGEKKSVEDYRKLADLGLKRVYIGMETGNEGLFKFLRKPGKPDDVISAVNTIKAGGVAVGVIILLGAGGHQYADTHVQDTIRAINAMRLDMDDLIYFSELIVGEEFEYAKIAVESGLTPLSSVDVQAQGETITQGLRFSPERGIPHISPYDIREFIF